MNATAAPAKRLVPEVRALERALAARVGAEGGAVAFASEVEAFAAALRTLGVRPGTRVTVPILSDPEPAIAATQMGCRLRFGDVDRTYTLAEAEGPVIATHLDGYPLDIPARIRSGPIIEDARTALGARLGDESVGRFGDLAVFGLGPWSVLHAGAGAVVVYHDPEDGEWLRLYARYAPLAESVASAALDALEHADDRIDRAREVAGIFDDAVRETVLIPPQRPASGLHACGGYRLLVGQGDVEDVLDRLRKLPFRRATPPVWRHRLVRGRRETGLVGGSLPLVALSCPPWQIEPEDAENYATMMEEL